MKILIPIALAVFLVGCGEDVPKQVETKQAVEVKKVVETKKIEPVTVKEPTKAVVPETIAPARTKTGAEIFKKCALCHGADASKQAMGKSQVIKGWDSAKLETTLNGYKDGSYGRAMKGLMKGQVSSLSAKEITIVSEYISKL